jgi:hypothetical protein
MNKFKPESEKLIVDVQRRHGLILLAATIDGKPFIQTYDNIQGMKKAKEHYKSVLPQKVEKIVFKRRY